MNRIGQFRFLSGVRDLYVRLCRVAAWVAPLLLRIALALPFLRSGLTRWDGFLSLSQGQFFLFEEQFKLHVLGGLYPLPFPDETAYLVGVLEIVLPALLLVGLGTRIAAAGLLGMTCVIQLIAPDGWANFHLYWAAISTTLISLGPGLVSLDEVIATRITNRSGVVI
jgi:putative oxidoreductase